MSADSPAPQSPRPQATTGISGLDDILNGGFTPNRMYLIEGVPGSGKTTLSLQFLLEGARRGEPVLYVSLSESGEEIRAVAESHGWTLDGITIRELAPSESALAPEEQYSIFHPSEIELTETTKRILADIEALKPTRLVLDSLSELRLLTGSPLRYRRQILALKQFFIGRHCTVILLDDLSSTERDLQVQSITHGVIGLEQLVPQFGADRRRLRVIKFRGKSFRSGFHDYVIRAGGLEVFPRVVAAESRHGSNRDRLSGGIEALDSLLGGGIERGTSTLIVGAAGTGKSTISAQFVTAAAERGDSSTLFIFDESAATLLARTTELGIELAKHVRSGVVTIKQVDPAEMSPGELAHGLRVAVEQGKASIVVIDSLNGYLNSMPEERYLTTQLHELLMYLGQQGVATILIGAHQGLVGAAMVTPIEASYLADAVILLRYFEAEGEVRQAISVVKKRSGEHERSIREFRLARGGIKIGEPLRNYRGVLTGVPIPQRSRRAAPEPATGRAV
ncbi:MAG TPA: ATPase domain-containing protein [Steroidobacteraceae bacterium]|jgi:circadian clock protein KaiC|nr:ATPase domain-containing protein [Steroidobacteraceae bacterium]